MHNMSEFNEAENLGPLPKADRNSELELLSIKAFESTLPADKFEFRRETVSDAGVDGSLELKIHSRYTNLRAQVQLKSTDSDKANVDGSISIQVTAANLNYLLNGPSPLYVLYVAPQNELRFAWAREEHQRIERATPDWKQQDTVTIRFYSALTPEAVDQIHRHILDEEQMHRRINDTLSATSNTETLVIGISPENLSITDADDAKRILLSSGRLIVTTGQPEKIKTTAAHSAGSRIRRTFSGPLPLRLCPRVRRDAPL
jgi:hypothetical protein